VGLDSARKETGALNLVLHSSFTALFGLRRGLQRDLTLLIGRLSVRGVCA